MQPSGPGSPGRVAMREGFERFRVRYFSMSPGARRTIFIVPLALSLLGVFALGWDLVTAVGLTGLALLAFAFTMRSPRGAATSLVLLAWAAMLLVFVPLYPPHSMFPGLLMLLGPVVAVAAHRIPRAAPWLTTLAALAAAGIIAGVLAGVVPAVSVWAAVAAAAVVLIARMVRSRTAQRLAQPARATRPRRRKKPAPAPEEALAELEDMVGLEPVKDRVRAIAASMEAARMRAAAGHGTERPMRHFVFTGPPGTGKTTVARILAKIFYSFGLLENPEVVEAQRSDLVGEFLGATAIKTGELVDRALGGVLFIDEAYSLINAGDGQPDRFGNEAVQTLLKRAEDDRDRLVIILAGYDAQMTDFLAANPGLASRFATRVHFPSYSPEELLEIAGRIAGDRGDVYDDEASDELERSFQDVHRRGVVDELGNGRFVRTLAEFAAEARDVRVVEGSGGSRRRAGDLVTVRATDVRRAVERVTGVRHDVPTVDEALADLDRLIGLDPVKQQIRGVAAQLRVGRLREAEGLPAPGTPRHFVFVGPPGTGKTTVARIIGRIFAAHGLLSRPDVVEAQRADLVGEHLGGTAIKTNRLIDSALGGVLFIDEAYSLHIPGYSGGDAFGAEAVQTLLKRAEDDRDRLVIILAGYPRDMDRFLASNAGLASRFGVRVAFPSYTPAELERIAVLIAAERGDRFGGDALAAAGEVFTAAVRDAALLDELGNGRFARSLVERASVHRDLRISQLTGDLTAGELTTITGGDMRAAAGELIP